MKHGDHGLKHRSLAHREIILQMIHNAMKKKNYDMMDHRKVDFDYDYREFKRQIADLDVRTTLKGFTFESSF